MKHLLTIGISALLANSGCSLRPGGERAFLDESVGEASSSSVHLLVEDRMAGVLSLDDEGAVLWAQTPVLNLSIDADSEQSFRLEVRNCMPDAELFLAGQGQGRGPIEKLRDTWCVFSLPLATGDNQFTIAPPDWDEEGDFVFADMGDIQTALDRVDEVFAKISETPDLRFVMSTGDVVEFGRASEYALFQEQLAELDIPFFSTVGNHELTIDAKRWRTRFGPFSVHFRFKGVDISYVDSADATLDDALYERLDSWLEAGKGRIHIFGTHFPPLDPVGLRNAGFRSRNEAVALLRKLSVAEVDLTLYGHVHSLYDFDNAGIPAFISGGGGALPERLDGIGRHFLRLEVSPIDETHAVDVIEVD